MNDSNELKEILVAVMLGKKSVRKAEIDITNLYEPKIEILIKVGHDLSKILEVAGAPLCPDGDIVPLMEWAKRINP